MSAVRATATFVRAQNGLGRVVRIDGRVTRPLVRVEGLAVYAPTTIVHALKSVVRGDRSSVCRATSSVRA
jgi:hypothetical protein